MRHYLTRLKSIGLRPLWTETDDFKSRRRCRTLFATPFAMLGGLAWGFYAAPMLTGGSRLFWSLFGAAAFGVFIYLEERFMPVLWALVNRLKIGFAAVLIWEAVVVGLLIFLVTRVLQAPLIPAVSTAVGLGAFYAIVMEYAICGRAASDVASMMGAGAGRGVAVPAQYSQAEALVQRGELDEAIGLYREAIEATPGVAALYSKLARALAKNGEHAQAVETLRAGIRRARLRDDQDAFLVRQIVEIAHSKLDDPSDATEDLRRLLARQPDGVHAEWATKELTELEELGRGKDPPA